jgi:hypothetical protein
VISIEATANWKQRRRRPAEAKPQGLSRGRREARSRADANVKAYKQLAQTERAFRSLKTVDIEVRPINHRRADRTDDGLRVHSLRSLLGGLAAVTRNTRQSPTSQTPPL